MNKVAPPLLAAVLFLSGCAKQEKKAEAATTKAPEPISIQTAAAQSRQLDRTLSVTGSLNPDETVSVSAEVPGRVISIPVDFGQFIRKGQVIAELDKQELTFALDRSKAALAQTLARLGLDPNQEDVRPEFTPAIRQAQAQMEDAKSKFENAGRLVKTGDIAQERYTEIQKGLQAREAIYEAARDDARMLLAQVQALKAEVSLAKKRLNDATVRAPFDGAVSQRLVAPGQYLKENTPLVTLIKTNPLRLRLEVPETAAGSIRPGTELSFTTGAAPGATFKAVVRELNPSLESKSRTLTAEARISANDARLRPGMFVQVQIGLMKGAEAVIVPKRAIYNVAGLNKLFVIRNGKAVEQRIEPGQELGDWVEIPGDAVHAGDIVAVSGVGQLTGGAPVKVVPKG
ncbi:MAG: efflux RND transporter periplasmic adaptor subunit [Bryobacteraceae bacterium]|nr:efflux RND transporter periplasmic adaptor subunit [Bryobacteraceae bacterium]